MWTIRFPGTVLPIALPIAVLLLAGCGDSDKPAADKSSAAAAPAGGIEKLTAAEILGKAQKASGSAESIQATGTIVDGEDKSVVDFRVGRQSATIHMVQGGMTFDLIRVGEAIYIKAPGEFWEVLVGAKNAKLLKGKYLVTNKAEERFKTYTAFTYLGTLIETLTKPEQTVTKGAVEQINGVRAISLVDGTKGKLYVATDGEPRILRLSKTGPDHIDFTYGGAVTATAPKPDEALKLGGVGKPA